MHYRLAGAYDSNIALLVTTGDDREASYARLSEVLRRTRLRGYDLATNLEFHHGLVAWFAARDVHAKPTTKFVVPYLTQVGLLKEEASRLDLTAAWAPREGAREGPGDARGGRRGARGVSVKETLVRRAIERLFDEPHRLSAWLSQERGSFTLRDGRLVWLRNPVAVLADTWHLLDMDWRREMPAALVIWQHDHELLQRALAFYARLAERMGAMAWSELEAALASPEPVGRIDAATWAKARSAHAGFQAGVELLGFAALVGLRAGFYDTVVNDDLTITIAPRLLDGALQARMARVLVPPPATKADEIVAEVGGMFYTQESPERPAFVKAGDHFVKGQTLYIIEVMKMFNRVLAPFAGRVDAVLVEGAGTIVQKGQTLFKVTPDERVVEVDHAAVDAERKAALEAYLAAVG